MRLKMRRAERSEKPSDERLSAADVADVKSSMAKRLTVEQQKQLNDLKKRTETKKRKLAEDAAPHDPERKKRLKKEEGLAAARTAVADSVQCKTLYQGRGLDIEAVLVVTPTDMRDARRSLRAIVGEDRVIKDPVKNLGAIAAETRSGSFGMGV